MSYPPPPNDPYPSSPYVQPDNYTAPSQPQPTPQQPGYPGQPYYPSQPAPQQPAYPGQEYYPPQTQPQPPQPAYPSQPYYSPQNPPPGASMPPPGYGMPPQQAGYPYGPVMMVQAPPSNGLAVTSMILGIIGLVFAFLWGIGVFGSILAVIFGHVALGQIKQSNGTQGGHGMAVAGLVMGYIVVGIVALCVGVALLFGAGLGFAGLFVHATPTPIPFPSK